MCIGFSGCFKIGPEYHRPEFEFETPEAYKQDTFDDAVSSELSQWWNVFDDAEINRLVSDIINNNMDIKNASARILELQSQFTQTRADRFPTVGLQGQAQRQKQAVTGISSSGAIDREYSTYNLSMPAGFELDLWGKLASAEDSARAKLFQAEENRRTIIQGLISEGISLYFEMVSFERKIRILQDRIDIEKKLFEIIKRRYELGLSSLLDLKQVEQTLSLAEAAMPNLRRNLGIIQQQIHVLSGTYPEISSVRAENIDYFQKLKPVKPGIPSELLLNRPDVVAAEQALLSLNAQIGVAKAGRFPKISLTGSFGYASRELEDLFKPEAELWNIAMGLTQPVFDAGKLKAGQKAAEARYEQGVYEYSKTVLNAFAEVENSLLTRKEGLIRREKVIQHNKNTQVTYDIARNQYLRGTTTFLNVLQSWEALLKSEESRIDTDLMLLTNRVALHRALGNGFLNIDKKDQTE
ncbi:MAG: efflux transporter outer membrane subunit [Desulfobacterales bacterium]|nr:efflux transporter outer membrane subunit [Desulfobacterales bacterium]